MANPALSLAPPAWQDSGQGLGRLLGTAHRADVQLHGLARLAAPAVKVVLERIAGRTVSQMREAIPAL